MIGRYTDYENVTDFIEYKLHRLIDDLAKAQRIDIATVISDALDRYLLNEIDIVFVEGWPHVVGGTSESDESDIDS
jgi:uncharacterized membrane-anchored protein